MSLDLEAEMPAQHKASPAEVRPRIWVVLVAIIWLAFFVSQLVQFELWGELCWYLIACVVAVMLGALPKSGGFVQRRLGLFALMLLIIPTIFSKMVKLSVPDRDYLVQSMTWAALVSFLSAWLLHAVRRWWRGEPAFGQKISLAHLFLATALIAVALLWGKYIVQGFDRGWQDSSRDTIVEMLVGIGVATLSLSIASLVIDSRRKWWQAILGSGLLLLLTSQGIYLLLAVGGPLIFDEPELSGPQFTLQSWIDNSAAAMILWALSVPTILALHTLYRLCVGKPKHAN
ncbi:hypothetical protein AB1L30_13965 [Bremerella sp. JC817]|uniref:hypothetical protein n=1 Tax=Bremerella sp. JC817 TaxID=3231756 RepID=UPI0034592856